MDEKQKLVFRIIFGAIIIAATIFLSFKYMLKGPPFIKVLAIGMIAAVIYLVISFIKSKSKIDE
jgi:hypothetical protein